MKDKTKLTPRAEAIVSRLVLGFVFVAGIFMLFVGIKETNRLAQETKNYISTNAYYISHDVYDSDENHNPYNRNGDGTTYQLTYCYEVDHKKYLVTTDYGTNHIPEKQSIREVKFNPDHPEEAVLVGTNSANVFIFIGAFFSLVSFSFVISALAGRGYFDKIKIDVMGTYIGTIFLIIGIAIILFQNGTTMSLAETIKSLGAWILIPSIFILVGILQLVKSFLVIIRKDKKVNNNIMNDEKMIENNEVDHNKSDIR